MEIEEETSKKAMFSYKFLKYDFKVQQKKSQHKSFLYVYITDENIAICSQSYQRNPDYKFSLQPNQKVTWVYQKNQVPYKLYGFYFTEKKDENQEIRHEFYGEETFIIKMKDIIKNQIFQARFQDEYEVLNQIGKGNYARVYSIRKRSNGQKYAVKCFEKAKLQSIEKGNLSLFNEMKIMRALMNHKNIINLYETFEGENTYYFVMDILEGQSLYDEMKKHSETKYKDHEARDIIRMLIEAVFHLMNKFSIPKVAECAKHNIMHRDIKPENILFVNKNSISELKLVDFGLATFQNEAPYIFPKCGTPGFVAPEIANLVDKTIPYNIICDMFGVGVIFHILLTGEALFPGKKFNEVLKKNKLCEIDLQGSLYEFMDIDAKDLLEKLLEKDPAKRITADEALQHNYFCNKQKLQKVQSFEQCDIENPFSKSENEELSPIIQIRPKQQSLFDKPLCIPYLKPENILQNQSDELNSFYAKDQNQSVNSTYSSNKKISDSAYYTIGSLDQKMVSPSFDTPHHKQSIQEEDKECDMEDEKK